MTWVTMPSRCRAYDRPAAPASRARRMTASAAVLPGSPHRQISLWSTVLPPSARQEVERDPDPPLVHAVEILPELQHLVGRDDGKEVRPSGQADRFRGNGVVHELGGGGDGQGVFRRKSGHPGQGVGAVEVHIRLHGALRYRQNELICITYIPSRPARQGGRQMTCQKQALFCRFSVLTGRGLRGSGHSA